MVDTNTNGDQVNSNPISSDSTSPSPGIKQSDQTVRSGVDVTDSNPIPPESIPPGADTERSKLDDDDHSYQSCASAHGDDDVLFDCGVVFEIAYDVQQPPVHSARFVVVSPTCLASFFRVLKASVG